MTEEANGLCIFVHSFDSSGFSRTSCDRWLWDISIEPWYSYFWILLLLKDTTREELPSLQKIRARCMQQLEQMRPDHMRRLNPTPYKVMCPFYLLNYMKSSITTENLTCFVPKQVSVSAKLYDFIHFLWLSEAPVGELQWVGRWGYRFSADNRRNNLKTK